MKITDLILQQYAPAARNIWRQRLSGQPLQSGWNEEMARYKLDGTIQCQKLK